MSYKHIRGFIKSKGEQTSQHCFNWALCDPWPLSTLWLLGTATTLIEPILFRMTYRCLTQPPPLLWQMLLTPHTNNEVTCSQYEWISYVSTYPREVFNGHVIHPFAKACDKNVFWCRLLACITIILIIHHPLLSSWNHTGNNRQGRGDSESPETPVERFLLQKHEIGQQ